MSEKKRPHPTTVRLPEQARLLLVAIQEKTGQPQSQIIIQAIIEYARKLGIKL